MHSIQKVTWRQSCWGKLVGKGNPILGKTNQQLQSEKGGHSFTALLKSLAAKKLSSYLKLGRFSS